MRETQKDCCWAGGNIDDKIITARHIDSSNLFLESLLSLLDAGAPKLCSLGKVDLGALVDELLLKEPSVHAVLEAAVLFATMHKHHQVVLDATLVEG